MKQSRTIDFECFQNEGRSNPVRYTGLQDGYRPEYATRDIAQARQGKIGIVNQSERPFATEGVNSRAHLLFDFGETAFTCQPIGFRVESFLKGSNGLIPGCRLVGRWSCLQRFHSDFPKGQQSIIKL